MLDNFLCNFDNPYYINDKPIHSIFSS